MIIHVRDRPGAIEFRSTKPWAAISVATYECDLPQLSTENRVGLLRLVFDDIDPTTRFNREDSWGRQEQLFTDEMALEVVNFVISIRDKVEDLLIHCQAGACRSPAIAAGITRGMLHKDDTLYFRRHTPNMLVYRKILEQCHGLVPQVQTPVEDSEG